MNLYKLNPEDTVKPHFKGTSQENCNISHKPQLCPFWYLLSVFKNPRTPYKLTTLLVKYFGTIVLSKILTEKGT